MARRTTVLVTLLVLVLAGCSSNSEPITNFTGSTCDYSGPSEFDVNTTVIFKFTNDSDETNVGFAVMNLDVGDNEDAAVEGTNPPTAVGTSRSFSVTFVETGQYGVACYLPGAGESETQRYITEFNVTD
jgi:uncharacterized cupredoxin-like copper-binding protein